MDPIEPGTDRIRIEFVQAHSNTGRMQAFGFRSVFSCASDGSEMDRMSQVRNGSGLVWAQTTPIQVGYKRLGCDVDSIGSYMDP